MKKSTYNDIFNSFAKISGINKLDLSTHISVKNSENVTITDNQFNHSVSYIFD